MPRRWCRGRRRKLSSRRHSRRSTRRPRARKLRIADLGTGSGALILALLSELPNAFGIGTDMSCQALVVARDNARRLAQTRATFIACDMAAALRGPFDAMCPIRLTSPPATSPRSPRTCAISIRISRSTAEPMGSTSIAPSPRRCPPCWRPAGFWSSSLASAMRNRWLVYLQRRGLRRHRRTPTLTVRHAPSLQENGHEREALDPGKNALGAPAKKHLEYRPEPTSLRPRNRPEMMVPRRLECPEQAFKSSAPRGWQRRPSKERKPESESWNRRQTGSPPFIPRRSSVGAHLYGTVARTTGVCNTAVKPRVRAAIAEDTLRVK